MIPRALIPYLGILKDSFREALSSRVLWVLLLISTLFLLVIAPFGISDRRATTLPRWAITNWPELNRRLATGAEESAPPAVRRLLMPHVPPRVVRATGPAAKQQMHHIDNRCTWRRR